MARIDFLGWTLHGAEMFCDQTDAAVTRLLDALHKASVSHPQAVLVTHTQAEHELDTTHPEYHLGPVYLLKNRTVLGTWSLDPERAQLWDILARHYFHAYEADHD